MITAAKLKTLTTFTADALCVALFHSGNKKALDMAFSDAKFVGLTNGNQFCYKAEYIEDNVLHKIKVFLNYDPVEGRVTASLN